MENPSSSIELSSSEIRNRMASESNIEDRNVRDTNSISSTMLPPLRTIFAEERRLWHATHLPGDRNETLSGGPRKQSRHEIQPSHPLPTDPPNQEANEHQQASHGKRKHSQINPTSLPTLRPKPLKAQPNQKVAIQTQVAALVSKSNYEHIVQTSAQDVEDVELFYSEALMANVTAKRQSNKLSEKGRRDRMKMALNALSDVISHHIHPDSDEGGISEEIEGRSMSKEVADRWALEPGDKISVVEAATLYIRQLQEKLVEANRRLDEARHRGLAI